MKFKDYEYHAIQFEEVKKTLIDLKNQIQDANSIDECMRIWKEFDSFYREFDSNLTLCSIRHSMDTSDSFYANENKRLDEIIPELESYFHDFDDALLSNPFLEEMKDEIAETFFLQKEMEKKSFSKKIVKELQEENVLSSKYQKLIASAQIYFEGKVYNLSSLESKMTVFDPQIRKKATKAYWNWFDQHKDELLKIFDSLVSVRTKMAKKLGYKNYIELGYYRMNRFDYNQEDVAIYRQQIIKDVVPVANFLYASQKKRLQLEKLTTWDEKVEFSSGNPKPILNEKECIQAASKMYSELSEDTGHFFSYMLEHDLLDYVARQGKAAGGYCTYIPKYKSPFIFANFNGSLSDVETLTHEAGHAYQVWSSQDIFPLDCIWPSYETCEIHSMSMEFITYPWMSSFFGENTNRYLYSHMSSAVKFLPYGALIDHFQHEIYEHPEYSSEERMACFRELEKIYLPHKNYDEIPFLENGGWWMRQLHVFMDPFYYIDYTLAQVCALQFWNRFYQKDQAAFKDYQAICRIGGKLPFKKVVAMAHLKNPFEKGCLSETMESVLAYLNSFDQNAL